MIVRAAEKIGYTQINNDMVNDKTLSFQDIGLLVFMLTKKENWTVLPKKLAEEKNCSIKSIYCVLKTLQKSGYVKKQRTKQGFVNWIVFGTNDVSKQLVEISKPKTPQSHKAINTSKALNDVQTVDLQPKTPRSHKAYPVDLEPKSPQGDKLPLIENNKNKDLNNNEELLNKLPTSDQSYLTKSQWNEFFITMRVRYLGLGKMWPESTKMMEDWEKKQYKKTDVIDAMKLALLKNKKTWADITAPHYFKKCVDNYINNPKPLQQKPNLPSYKKVKQQPVEPIVLASKEASRKYIQNIKNTVSKSTLTKAA